VAGAPGIVFYRVPEAGDLEGRLFAVQTYEWLEGTIHRSITSWRRSRSRRSICRKSFPLDQGLLVDPNARRPVHRPQELLDDSEPYAHPAGVHGMCGYNAALVAADDIG
jgi:hypothetical protein